MAKILPVLIILLIFIIALFVNQKIDTTPKVIGWIPYWDQANAVESFKKNVNKTDFVSLFWYRIDENGTLGTYTGVVEDKEIIDFAHRNNVAVLALIANLGEEDNGVWDPARVDHVISSKAKREKHIRELVDLVEKNNFDGVDIDYEALKRSQRKNFTLFIKELSSELHKRNKILGVAIHPKTSENNPMEDNGSAAQDLAQIGKYADQLYFMTYLEHGISSSPGPIGSLSWMEKVIGYGLSKVPPRKTFLGIGLMGTRWQKSNEETKYEGVDEEMTFLDVYNTSETYKAMPIWDEESKTPYINFKDNGENIIWFENAESIKLRVDMADAYKVGGIAFWRLGGEDERLWSFVK